MVRSHLIISLQQKSSKTHKIRCIWFKCAAVCLKDVSTRHTLAYICIPLFAIVLYIYIAWTQFHNIYCIINVHFHSSFTVSHCWYTTVLYTYMFYIVCPVHHSFIVMVVNVVNRNENCQLACLRSPHFNMLHTHTHSNCPHINTWINGQNAIMADMLYTYTIAQALLHTRPSIHSTAHIIKGRQNP